MTGKAERWFASYITIKKNVDWSEFIMDVCNRFREELGSKVVEDFHKLQQMGSVEDYLEKFEELKSLLLQNIPLPDDYFVSSFVGGLKPQLKPFVKALNPVTLDEAIKYARLHEDAGNTERHYQRSPSPRPPLLPTPRMHPNSGGSGYQPSRFIKPQESGASSATSPGASSVKYAGHSFQPTRLISAAERADKIAKGLCYYCDHPYERGHKCPTKKSQLFLVEVPAGNTDDGSPEEEEGEPPTANNLEFELLETEPCISLQALNGIQGFQTMRVTGYVGKKAIQILIDSGSTHNFVDQSLAQRLGCKMQSIQLQPIAVADGSELKCSYICPDFAWKLQGTEFHYEVLLIPLGSCDMVLGIQWLSQLGTI